MLFKSYALCITICAIFLWLPVQVVCLYQHCTNRNSAACHIMMDTLPSDSFSALLSSYGTSLISAVHQQQKCHCVVHIYRSFTQHRSLPEDMRTQSHIGKHLNSEWDKEQSIINVWKDKRPWTKVVNWWRRDQEETSGLIQCVCTPNFLSLVNEKDSSFQHRKNIFLMRFSSTDFKEGKNDFAPTIL